MFFVVSFCKKAAYLQVISGYLYELILGFAHVFYDIRETDDYDG